MTKLTPTQKRIIRRKIHDLQKSQGNLRRKYLDYDIKINNLKNILASGEQPEEAEQ